MVPSTPPHPLNSSSTAGLVKGYDPLIPVSDGARTAAEETAIVPWGPPGPQPKHKNCHQIEFSTFIGESSGEKGSSMELEVDPPSLTIRRFLVSTLLMGVVSGQVPTTA
jgi:hypothetical protein